jgi:hypothetical protein
MVKEVLVHLPWPVGIGICKVGLAGKVLKSEMPDLADTAGEAPEDLTDAFRLGQRQNSMATK